MDLTYSDQFKYSHNNPYHTKLEEFDEFVLRDNEAEELKGKWNQNAFKRRAPLVVEIGSGYGEFMRHYLQENPKVNFVGMDYRFKRSFKLAQKLKELNLKHFRYLRARAERIHHLFGAGEIDELLIFFSDPWPKTRHHKKRLINQNFLNAAKQALKPGGRLLIKTDHDDYAEWMRKEFAKNKQFKVIMDTGDLYREESGHFLANFQTKFEKIFLAKGVKIKAFELVSMKKEVS